MSREIELLPPGLRAALETAAGVQIRTVRPRGGGGASRMGAELTLACPDGSQCDAYLNYDTERAGAGDDAAFSREIAVLRALTQPEHSQIRSAPLITAIPEMRALLTLKIAGDSQFNNVRDISLRSRIAADFMGQLANLHAVNPCDFAGLGEPVPIRLQIERRLRSLRDLNEAATIPDPQLHLALGWLSDHIPSEPDRLVIVHGDAGPGNFLFDGDHVSALLDWELVHIGDPMADLAMLCLRSLFQPFAPFPEAFAAYENSGGARVDLARIRYWRLLFQTEFAARARHHDPKAPPPSNLGMNMVYAMVHRRVAMEALIEAEGRTLDKVHLPDAPVPLADRSFEIALNDLRSVIVPRVADQQAEAKAKGLARLIKWWRANARFQAVYDSAETDDIEQGLCSRFSSIEGARAAFAQAVFEGKIDRQTASQIIYSKLVRDTALMADAMGSLSTAKFAPIE